jgi:hypothetical protein
MVGWLDGWGPISKVAAGWRGASFINKKLSKEHAKACTPNFGVQPLGCSSRTMLSFKGVPGWR